MLAIRSGPLSMKVKPVKPRPGGPLDRLVRPGALMRDCSRAFRDPAAPEPGMSLAGPRPRRVPARRGLTRLIGAGLAGWLAAGCGGQASPPPAVSSHAAPASSPAGPTAAARAAAP